MCHLAKYNKVTIIGFKSHIEMSIHWLFFQWYSATILQDFAKYCILTLLVSNWDEHFDLKFKSFVVKVVFLKILLTLNVI